MTRDGVCNPVTHVLKAIETFKRFILGYKPRPVSKFYDTKRPSNLDKTGFNAS